MTSKITFKVHRKKPELVTPAKPTPRELKLLSDIDDQQGLRLKVALLFIYRPTSNPHEVDPVVVIKKAITETLVYYYPFAGRLRDAANGKLAVECTGEGVLFTEADADVTFAELEEADALVPPFPSIDELIFDVEGSSELLNTPLLIFQVTRLKRGGFILGLRFAHNIADAAGMSKFVKSLCELARGSHAPSVPPVWDRHLLLAKTPPVVTQVHREYEAKDPVPEDESDLVIRSFFFGDSEIAAIRKLLPANTISTTPDTLASFLWRIRSIALSPDPNTEMRLTCPFYPAPEVTNPPLPPGYYGNINILPVAIATAKDLVEKPLEFALKLLQQATSSVTKEYVESVMALLVTRGRPAFVTAWLFLVTDFTQFYFGKADFGPWGMPVYGGIASAGLPGFSGASFYMVSKNDKGETGIVVPVSLPTLAMKKFVEQLDAVLTPNE